jgi:hypothetical protein
MIGTSLQVAKKKINFRFGCWANSRQTCLCWDKQKTDMNFAGTNKRQTPPVQTELYVI